MLQHYCPFCFKGRIGVSSGVQVSKGSPMVDATQVLHAARGNGLCPLDLKAPGEPCENQALCRMTCLVCGQSMVDGTEPEFETFLRLFCGDEAEKGVEAVKLLAAEGPVANAAREVMERAAVVLAARNVGGDEAKEFITVLTQAGRSCAAG